MNEFQFKIPDLVKNQIRKGYAAHLNIDFYYFEGQVHKEVQCLLFYKGKTVRLSSLSHPKPTERIELESEVFCWSDEKNDTSFEEFLENKKKIYDFV